MKPLFNLVKCLSPQNTLEDSGVNSVAAKPSEIEVNGDHFFKRTKIYRERLHFASVVSSTMFLA